MSTLLTAAPRELEDFSFRDSFAGTNGATSTKRPDKIPEGQVFLHGVITDPNVRNETNGALAEIEQLKAGEAYRDGGHPLHEAAVERMATLFRFLHPED